MRNIGISVTPPQRECDDSDCPFHSNLSVRGRILEGTVVSDDMKETIIIRRDYNQYISKYMRYLRKHTRIPAHISPCIEVKKGDRVKIMECRPLSKSVSFVVIEKIEEK